MLDKHVQLEVRGTEKLSWVEAGDSRVKNKSKKLLSTVTRSKLVANPPAQSMPTLENLSGEGSENKSKEEKK
jgi:hypothetical protein